MIAVVNTKSPNWNLVHDAARPFAVVEFAGATFGKIAIRRVISRHTSYRGASIKAGKVKRIAGAK